MQIPSNKGYGGRVSHALQGLLGSRFFVAVSGACLMAFLAHVLTAPDRFPQFVVINFQTMGILPPLPPAPELPELSGTVKDAAHGAVQAGLPYVQQFLADVGAKISAWFAANPAAVVIGNYVGLVASGAALLLGAYLLARQQRPA
ncbi:MAG: hypothetical protein IV086_01020 [Hyphomonadaceae bacterium]|nr:MAG: hypothetical protein FD160_2163 [Caulobacteraceae bacterium]MBT9444259.1 hypothetical protein [Hyphomonadaceae bacterium]